VAPGGLHRRQGGTDDNDSSGFPSQQIAGNLIDSIGTMITLHCSEGQCDQAR
jgi:hypothetical protein